MPVVFKNPELPDYFVERSDVRLGSPPAGIAPITDDYEAGRVVVFPELKLKIDHRFWSELASDDYPGLKKLQSSANPDDPKQDHRLDKRLKAAGLPWMMERRLRRQMRQLSDQVIPIYERLYGDYRFGRRQVVWRLNTIRNENLHIDTYKEPLPEHFARLLINLDTQPRIWMTSYTADQLHALFGDKVETRIMREGDGELFTALNRKAFGGLSTVWWDRQPRHMVYFQPGECWCVDSRQVSHQVFYGRRAVSFDFFVDPASMKRPERHYLALERSYRTRA